MKEQFISEATETTFIVLAGDEVIMPTISRIALAVEEKRYGTLLE